MGQIGVPRIAYAALWRVPRPLAEHPRFRRPAARVARDDLLSVRDVREIGQTLVGPAVAVVARVWVHFLVVENRNGLGCGTQREQAAEQGAERHESTPVHRDTAGVLDGFHFEVFCLSSDGYHTRSLYIPKKSKRDFSKRLVTQQYGFWASRSTPPWQTTCFCQCQSAAFPIFRRL